MYQVPYHSKTASTAVWKEFERTTVSIFNQMIRNTGEGCGIETSKVSQYQPRTFKETINDQIAYHQRKIAELEAVKNSLTPEVEAFVEAIQKLG